jgi:hypothetical protein
MMAVEVEGRVVQLLQQMAVLVAANLRGRCWMWYLPN